MHNRLQSNNHNRINHTGLGARSGAVTPRTLWLELVHASSQGWGLDLRVAKRHAEGKQTPINSWLSAHLSICHFVAINSWLSTTLGFIASTHGYHLIHQLWLWAHESWLPTHGYQHVCQLMSHGYQLIYQLMAVNSWLSTCRPWLSTHGNQLMAINSWLSFHLSTSSWRSTHSPIDSRLSSTFQLIASTRGYQLIEHLWLLKSWLSTHLSVNSWLSTHLSNLCCQSPIRVSSGSWQSWLLPFCVAVDMMEDPCNGGDDAGAGDAGSSTGKHVTIEYAAKVHGDNQISMTGAYRGWRIMSKSFPAMSWNVNVARGNQPWSLRSRVPSDIDLYGPYWPWYLRAVKHLLCRFPKQKRCLICLTIFRIHSTQCRD